MLPVLLDLKFIKIYTFGVFLVLAFFWSAFLLWKNFRLTAYKEEDMFDGFFSAVIGALITGRVVYIALHFKDFGTHFLRYILINGYPGFSIYGCLAGGLIGLLLYIRTKKYRFTDIIDYFIAPIFIGLGFGKLGSFFAGSEVGTQTKFPLSIKYVGYSQFRHLTPFYEAILFFIGAFIAYKLLFSVRRETFKKGFAFYFFLFYFSLIYFIFDKLKEHRLYLLGQSFNGILSAVVLGISVIVLLISLKNTTFKNIFTFKNFKIPNGNKTSQTVYSRPAEEIRESEQGNPSSDKTVEEG